MNVRRSYRIPVHAHDTMDPSDGTVYFTIPLSHLLAPPVLPGPIIRPFEGRSETQSWSFEVSDAGSLITSRLATNGRMHLLGRLVEVQMQEDGGAWETIGVARWTDLDQSQGPGRYTIGCEDERWKERNTEVWATTNTTVIWPAGIRYPFRRYPAREPVRCRVVSNTIGLPFTLIEPADAGILDDGVQKLMSADMLPNASVRTAAGNYTTAGNFSTLRANINGVDFGIVSFDSTLLDELVPGPSVLWQGQGVTTPDGRLVPFWVYWPDDQPAPNSTVNVFLYAPTHEPSESLPLHVGVASVEHEFGTAEGLIHPFDLLERLYIAAGVRYSEDAMALLQADALYPLVAFRITSKDKLARWTEEHIYRPNLVVPFIDDEGRIAPRPVHLPRSL